MVFSKKKKSIIKKCFLGLFFIILIFYGQNLYAFNPSANVSGCEVWLDGADPEADGSPPSNGTVLSSWVDKSGQGNDISQPTADYRPVYLAAGFGGKDSVSFDGTNDYLQSSAFSSSLSQPNSIFVVAYTYRVVSGCLVDGLSAGRHVMWMNAGTRQMYAGGYVNGGSADYDRHINYGGYNTTNSSYYIDGVLKGSGNVGSASMAGITLGARYLGDNIFDGRMAEVIVYDNLISTSDRLAVENYLANRWDIIITMNIDLRGDSDYDWVTMDASEVYPTGTLVVNKDGSYEPSDGDSYTILRGTIGSGTFSSVSLPSLTGGLIWSTANLYVNGTLAAGNDSDSDGVIDNEDAFPYDPLLTTTPNATSTLPVTGNLKLWLDGAAPHGDQTTANLSNNDMLETWVDFSGNGFHASQNTTANKPLYLTGMQNSLSVVTFNYDTIMNIAAANVGSPWTAMFLVKGDSSIDRETETLLRGGSRTVKYEQWQNGGVLGFTVELVQDYSFLSISSPYDNWRVITYVCDGSNIKGYLNDLSYSEPLDSTLGMSQIGSFTESFIGDMAEVIVYDANLSTTNRAEIGYYLSQKWGIESEIDSDGDGLTDDIDPDPTDPDIDDDQTLDGADVFIYDPLLAATPNAVYTLPITSGLTFWLDGAFPHGDQTTANLSSSDNVQTWVDLSNSSLHVTETNSSYQPKYVDNILNNEPIMRFDGNDELLRSSVLGSDLFSVNELSIFIAMKHASLTDSLPFYWYLAAGKRVSFHNPYGNGTIYFDAPEGVGHGRISEAGHSDKVGDWYIWDFEKNSDGDNYVYLNNTLLFSGGWIDGIDTAASIALGIGQAMDGDIAEILVYNRDMTESERYEIKNYLALKWDRAITGNRTLTWDSGGLDDNISSSANWEYDGIPSANDKFVIDSTADDISWDGSAPVTINALALESSFAGTLNIITDLYVSENVTVNAGIFHLDTTELNCRYFRGTGSLVWTSGTLNVLEVDFDLNNTGTGTLSPGFSPEITYVSGNYTQGTSANLYMELADTSQSGPVEYDQLHVTGDIILDGTLEIVKINSFEPALGHSFDLLDWTGTVSGNFSSILLPTLNAGLGWDLSNLYLTGVISVINTPGNTGLTPVLWLDADDAGSLASANGDVLGWVDKSGNGNNAQQLTTTNQPSLSEGVLNSKNTISFDGVDNYLSCQDSASLKVGSNDFTVIILAKQNVNETSVILKKGKSGSTGPDYKRYSIHYSLGKAFVDIDDDTTLKSIRGEDQLNGSYHILMGSREGTNIRLRVDGAEAVDSPVDIGSYGSIDTDFDLMIGAGQSLSGTGYWLDGDIAEIIMFDTALSTANRIAVMDYLADKWGLADIVDLDSDGVPDVKDEFPTDNSRVLLESNIPDALLAVSSNMVLWLTDTVTVNGTVTAAVSVSGSVVEKWYDYSANKNNASQATESARPLLDSNAINNKSAVKFDGINDYFYVNSVSPISSSPHSIFFIAKVPAIIGNQALVAWNTAAGTNDEVYIMADTGEVRHYDGGVTELIISDDLRNSTFLFNTLVTGSELNTFLNGELKSSVVDFVESSDRFSIGAELDSGLPGDYYKDHFAEIIIIDNVVSTQNRIAINYYLSEKWGLRETVDSDGDGVPDAKDEFPTDSSRVLLESNIPDVLLAVYSNMLLWLTDMVTVNGQVTAAVQVSGSAVEKWYDYSASGHTSRQEMVASQPVYVENVYRSGNGVRFEGDEFLGIWSAIDISDWTMVLVTMMPKSDSYVWNTFSADSGGNNRQLALQQSGNNGKLGTYVSSFNGANLQTNSLTGAHLLFVIGTGSQTQFYINQVFQGVVNAKSATDIYTIGNNLSGNEAFGDVLEVLLFNRELTVQEQKDISEYLSDKWEIPGASDAIFFGN